MKNLKIEGFDVSHDAEDHRDFYPLAIEIIEDIIITGMSVAEFYHRKLCMGYRNKRLEPFMIRETKKDIVLDYTGAMGGNPYRVRISKA